MFEKVVWVLFRTAVIFLYTFLMLRLLGKRQLAQLTTFDLLIIISLGSAVGDVMIYPEDEAQFLNSLVAIAAVVVIQLVIYRIIAHHVRIGRVLEGRATILIRKGKVLRANLDREEMNMDELMVELRQHNVFRIRDVEEAILESTGQLSVIKRKR